jgi:hypothetical protein
MNRAIRLITAVSLLLLASAVPAQEGNRTPPLLPDKEAFLLTVFLKHDQTMNNIQRRDLLKKSGFNDMFPPEGVEIVDHYVMMGIGQVIVMRVPPERLRSLNLAIENGAWGAYQTEFYVTYDLAAARAAQAAAEQ